MPTEQLAVSAALTLETVAVACDAVSEKINDVFDVSNPWTTLKTTTYKGKVGFRYTQVVVINGEKYEVQVRSMA